jgi:hypothetical protein
MKITKVTRTRSAQCFPQVVDLTHFSSFELLSSGVIVATALDGKSGELFKSWDSADFENRIPDQALLRDAVVVTQTAAPAMTTGPKGTLSALREPPTRGTKR